MKWPLTLRPVTAPKPMVVVLCLIFCIMGTVSLFAGATPGSISALLPDSFRVVWVIMIATGSWVTLIGSYLNNPVSGLFTTQVGLLATGYALMFYGAGSMYLTTNLGLGFTTAMGGAALVGVGAGFLWERHHLMITIRNLPK